MLHAFTKFDPRAFLESEEWSDRPAKLAKVAKLPERRTTLAALAGLAGPSSATQNPAQPATWGDGEEERAALVEYSAGAPRAWVEAFARLNPAQPPADVAPSRWLQFIDDCGRFLDSDWANHAAALGWGPLDLFGCDRERPFARIEHAGLLWLLNGRKLVALTGDTATIETSTSARQTYYRRSAEPGCLVLAWELANRNYGGGGSGGEGP